MCFPCLYYLAISLFSPMHSCNLCIKGHRHSCITLALHPLWWTSFTVKVTQWLTSFVAVWSTHCSGQWYVFVVSQIETCMHARTLHPWTHTHHAHIPTNHKDSCLSTTLAEWRSGNRSRLQSKIKTYGHSPAFHWSNKSQNEVNFILAKNKKTKKPKPLYST